MPSGLSSAPPALTWFIVKNMRVTLLGVVDNDGDRTIAEMKARQVPGSFEVKNHRALFLDEVGELSRDMRSRCCGSSRRGCRGRTASYRRLDRSDIAR
jgi:hypothetical protein